MMFHQRICLSVLKHGLRGLPLRLARKFTSPARGQSEGPARELAAAKADYERIVSAFHARLTELELERLQNFYWYHTIDLGRGLLTPGDYDYRELLPRYGFPDDMRGMTVLDVGSATGFFAFEFERRGARVLSVELPSIADWDIVHAEKEKTFAQMRLHPDEPLAEVSFRLVEGPFHFCRQMLKSRVERHHHRVYDLTAEKLGVKQFDLIFVGDVLGHLFSPLQALDVLASLCGGTIVISLDVAEPLGLLPEARNPPSMRYVGGNIEDSGRSWWIPDRACLEQMLSKVGFRSVSMVGEYTSIVRRCWLPSHRAIYHAKM